MKLIDLTGKRFGKLIVLGRNNNYKRVYWDCLCDCGTKKVVLGGHLKSGKTMSCGCVSKERIALLNKTHGDSRSRLYSIWSGIKTRCLDKNSSCYHRYGGRGISICSDWAKNYESFKLWSINNGYNDNLTIDRINNNGDYEPLNCRWTSMREQANNTCNTIKISYMGNIYSAKQLAALLKINYKKFIYGFHKFDRDLEKAINYAKLYKRRTD